MAQHLSRPPQKFQSCLKTYGRPLAISTHQIAVISTSKLRASPVEFEKVAYIRNQEIKLNKLGVTVIRFDPIGALFAACSSSGLIRVFDFDEYLCKELLVLNPHQGSAAPLMTPVQSIDTRKDISDLCWSPNSDSPDEVVVSFFFSPTLFVYNLNQVEAPMQVLEIGRDGVGGAGLSGHLCVTYLGEKGDRVLAGTSSGCLRMWHLARPGRMAWEVNMRTLAAKINQRSSSSSAFDLLPQALSPYAVVAVKPLHSQRLYAAARGQRLTFPCHHVQRTMQANRRPTHTTLQEPSVTQLPSPSASAPFLQARTHVTVGRKGSLQYITNFVECDFDFETKTTTPPGRSEDRDDGWAVAGLTTSPLWHTMY